MPRSELIKFRLSGHAKARISRHAERSQKSVAALMRDLTAEAIIGRSANEAVRADMAVFRQLGNTVLGIAEEIGEDHRHGAALRAVGQRLRDLSSRHIGAMR